MSATPATGPDPQSEQVPLLNIANVLTILRLLLVPVFVWLMLLPGGAARVAALLVFCVAAGTDRLDGQLARSRNLVTSFGKLADPVADKALTLSAFVLLSADGTLWWWVTALIVLRELGITVMRFLMLRRAVMAASRGGKVKTTLQMAGVIGLLAPWDLFLPAFVAGLLVQVFYGVIAAALVVTVVTGLDYVRQAVALSRAQVEQG
ncbi:CDP-diacylglycerol--glycerol-3-phosphate 3-phosphatidyltransferase [Actinomyces sp. 2119]|uniref:CDP-diacylglycerol--glycerol-3-phosphate 3-phosphatidyltransferase n=1 Tax=Actinomyces sp. 2119 TaxID=2321393 RepID=UPI000E6BB614|nr:CDP-diacylglycerol--glycerol-3-phosphate 3-phosphatidyltransferase [Actinomyces sp. 2119]RJF42572.1 CDP-diacylglycerol--glycerol-3-phosphate 3-phosphatidyltransferase [Actinomyces sp. 2119]